MYTNTILRKFNFTINFLVIRGLGTAIDAERMTQKGDLLHLFYYTKPELKPF
jgi:hypothetical protein